MKEKIAIFSVLVNIVLGVVKLTAGFIAGSSAVLAEGVHSGIDIFSSAISFFGIKAAQKPVDKKHPYGHYKFEVLAGLIITIILFLTGLFILLDSIHKFKNPSPLNISCLTLVVMLVSAVVNEVMARLKIYFGKKENSISLLSDGFHSRIDVFCSLAVFLGLILTRYWLYFDSFLAFLIGCYILKQSFSLGKEAVDSLLDVSAGEEIEERIKRIVKAENIEIPSLKTQKKGSVITANLEIKLPSSLSVDKAEKISEKLREKLMEKIKNLAFVTIQIKSHDLSTGFYKPFFGRGFGWQKRGRMKEVLDEARGKGSGGYCFCSKCGYKIQHQRGIPCSSLYCPNCKISLKRK